MDEFPDVTDDREPDLPDPECDIPEWLEPDFWRDGAEQGAD